MLSNRVGEFPKEQQDNAFILCNFVELLLLFETQNREEKVETEK